MKSRPPLVLTVCMAAVMAGHVYSHPTGTAYSYPTVILRRQYTQSPTSSVNWWPYPSWSEWGQVSSSATTSDPRPTGSPVVPDPDNAVATTSPSISGSDESLVPTTTTGPASPADSLSSSASLVRITALPPASSESSVTRSRVQLSSAKDAHSFNIAYLAPLFGVLGAIAGALCIWLLHRFLHIGGRSNPRGSTLVPGPRYTPSPRLRRQASLASPVPPATGEAPTRSSLSSGQALFPAGESRKGSQKGSWLGRAFSSRSKASSAQAPSDAIGATEEDPFLDNSSPVAGNTPIAYAAVERRRTGASAVSHRVTSPDPYSTVSDGEDAVPYETLRHKSIRRGILERLRFGSLHRSKVAYERSQTDENDNEADGESSPTTESVQRRRGHKRADSDAIVESSRRPTFARHRSQLVPSPPGFRIVIEDPETGALLDEDVTSPPATPTPTRTQQKQSKGSDIFTPMPVRRSTDAKRNSPYNNLHPASPSKGTPLNPASSATPSPTMPALVAAAAAAEGPRKISRVDSSVLPASPPMVMSPPLESQLFFGSTPSLNLNLHLPAPAQTTNTNTNTTQPSAPKPSAGAGKQKETKKDKAKEKEKKERTGKKLQTHRSPLLPFPSSSSPFRGLLKKSPKGREEQAAAIPVTLADRAHSDSSTESESSAAYVSMAGLETETGTGTGTGTRGTPAERYHARRAALRKVDEIVSHSWGQRQMSGSGFPGSPNNFGKGDVRGTTGLVEKGRNEDGDEDGDALMMGIEQRLEAALRR